MKKLVAISAALFAATILTFQVISTSAQQAGAPQGPPRAAAGRGPGIEALALDDHTGFEAIFDGKTLKGWDGDSAFWRVENDVIIGESAAERPLKANTFLIWRGGQPKDFELKLEYRINSTNSGVQYRSVELPEVGKWVLKGYQADIDFQNTYTGQLYEERGRGFLALRGQMTHLQQGKKRMIADLRGGDELKSLIKVNDWNQLHIIARGNALTHILNGHLMAAAIDDDAANRAMGGLIGFQMHVGPPMKVEYRNIWLKNL
ncbi:MAG: 3-keto-disaccharide hydrolase [Blastocatellia bacterium]